MPAPSSAKNGAKRGSSEKKKSSGEKKKGDGTPYPKLTDEVKY